MNRWFSLFRMLSIQTRITIFVGLILILIFISFVLIAQYFYLRHFHEHIRQHATVLVNYASQAALESIEDHQEISPSLNISSLVHQEDVLCLAILGPDGAVLEQAVNPEFKNFTLDEDVLRNETENFLKSQDTLRFNSNGLRLEGLRLIKSEDQVWGILYLVLDLVHLRQIRYRVRGFSLLIGLLFIFFGIFLIKKFVQKVVSPIADLVQGTEEVSTGNFNFQVEVKDEGELGQLARKFNEMTLQLRYYYKQKELLNKKLHQYSEMLEERIQERTQQLRNIKEEVVQILHQIPVGLLVVGKDYTVRWYNEEFLKILNIKDAGSLIGSHILRSRAFRHEGLVEKIITTFRDYQRNSFQFTYQPPDKECRLLEVYSQPLTLEGEKVSGMIYVIKDITHETEMEKKINRIQRLESMGILAGGIAHDFNNALAIILPNAQMLKFKLKGHPEYARYLDTIEKATEQAAELTNQILSFARGNKKGKQEVVNLNRVVEEFTNMFRRVVDRKILIKKELQKSLWNVAGDKSQIEQVLMNLSVNAKDAMPNGGQLTFRTSNFEIMKENSLYYPQLKAGKYIKLEIIDTGNGIPPYFIDKIFDPFFTSKTDGKGTGLGLSTVYGIIKAYEGGIDVHSEVGVGTRFTVYLPATTKRASRKSSERFDMELGRGKILLVDDERLLQQTLSHMLKNLNYDVLLANNGEEAVSLYRRKRPEIDLIIMDLQMPVMDGFEAAKLIWKENPEAKIIFSSGYADATKIEELRKKGAEQFLKKPYKLKDLVDMIHKTVSSTN